MKSVIEFCKSTVERLKQAITQPRHELDRWQRAARYVYELGRCGLRQLSYDRAPQMAGELAFRTLFGLLPVMVVATVLVKAMGMEQWIFEPLTTLLKSVGLDQIRIMPVGGSESSETLDMWLQARVREATRINMAAIGWAGIVVTAYAAIGLVVSVENTFNTIYRVQRGRPWTRRVPLYWFMLTVSPLVLLMGAYVNSRFEGSLASLQGWEWLSATASLGWSLLVLWIVMTLIYLLMPNADVHIRPALCGALVAAVLLEIGKRSLGVCLQNALSISQLYGSLGLIPLFMFWVYLMWLVVLFGLEVSAILQTVQGRQVAQFGYHPSSAVVFEPTMILIIMEIVARNFEQGNGTTIQELTEGTSLPEPAVSEMVSRLVDERLLHELEGEDGAVSMTRPPNKIPADQLIQIGFKMVDSTDARRSAVTQRLRDVQRQLLAGDTLASLFVPRRDEKPAV